MLMAPLRRVLAPVAAIWLCCQVGTMALVPVALWITAADPHATECTCGHGAGAMCPMHHKPTGESAPCAMQAAAGSEAAVFGTAVGMAGLISEPTLTIRPASRSGQFRPPDVQITGERPVPPDPPPPRA
jgi:hypothetical protein